MTGKLSVRAGDLGGPYCAECQAPGVELSSSRRRKFRAVGNHWRKSGARVMNMQQLGGQSRVQEGASGCSWKRSFIKSG